MLFTSVFIPVAEGFIGFVEEIPGTNTQGRTILEARANLREAVQLILQSNRELAERSLVGELEAFREPFEMS